MEWSVKSSFLHSPQFWIITFVQWFEKQMILQSSVFLERDENESQKGQVCFSDFHTWSPGPPFLCFPPNPSHGEWYSSCHLFLSHHTTVVCSVFQEGIWNVRVFTSARQCWKAHYMQIGKDMVIILRTIPPISTLLYPVYWAFNP